jgi:hypothetical protein
MKRLYKILVGTSAVRLESKVQQFLDSGWELRGDVFVCDTMIMHQVVTRPAAASGSLGCIKDGCVHEASPDSNYCIVHTKPYF